MTPIPTEDPSQHLQARLISRWDDLLSTLQSGSFYVELLLIAIAFALGSLTAKFVTKKILNYLESHPPQRIDRNLLIKPIGLLGPLLVLPYLGVVKAIVTGFSIGGAVTEGVLQLCYAYILTKAVLMVIRQKIVAYLVATSIILNAILHALRVSHSVSAYLDSISFDAGKFHITALHFVHGFFIFVITFWAASLSSSVLESYLKNSTRLSNNSRELTLKLIRMVIYFIAVLITLSAVGIDLTAFAIFSGALGVGIGLGLQKMSSNFISGVTMLMERSIRIGDLIEVGGYTGWVRQLKIRYLLLETSDGREIIIPNEELISTRVVNWTLTTSMARIEINTTISFDSDAEKAKKLLLEAALEHPRCLKDPRPDCWLREFSTEGLKLMLNFWISDIREGRNGPQSDVMFLILKKFNDNGIKLAKA